MTRPDIERLMELHAKAKGLPWWNDEDSQFIQSQKGDVGTLFATDFSAAQDEVHAGLICAAVNALPSLASYIASLEVKVAELEQLLGGGSSGDTTPCH